MPADCSSSGSEPEEAQQRGSEDSEDDMPDRNQDIPFEVFVKRLEAQSEQSGLPCSCHRQRGTTIGDLQSEAQKEVSKPKRENKNRPLEASAKRPVKRHRDVVEGLGRRSRDPRFDGQLQDALPSNDQATKRRYAFVYDQQLPQERQSIKQALKKAKGDERKKELQGQLTRVEQTIRAEEGRRAEQHQKQLEQAAEKEAVKSGKKPYFANKADRKQQELLRKYQALKATGRLEKLMAKRRRKNASADHRYIPGGRRSHD
ncbi:hypothetical protein WJX74_007780 [Apatococcus lobatus]|uniref:rRNA biogenesis protein RRP36 n=1 Tax=Apatococcus lobatus TaxID=904363 RepID=A0AAW1QX32_9CHLO